MAGIGLKSIQSALFGLQKLALCVITIPPVHEEIVMAVALKLPDELIDIAKPCAAAMHPPVPKQIEHWARLGKAVEENPDLPVQFIQDTLLALEEANAGLLTEYQFSSK